MEWRPMKQNPPPKFEVSKKRFWTTNKIVPGMIFRFLFELQLQPAPWRKDGYDHLQVVNQQGGGWMLKSKGSARFLRPAILFGSYFLLSNLDQDRQSRFDGPVRSDWPTAGVIGVAAVREWSAAAAAAAAAAGPSAATAAAAAASPQRDRAAREPRPAFGRHWEVRVDDTVGRAGWARAVPGPRRPACREGRPVYGRGILSASLLPTDALLRTLPPSGLHPTQPVPHPA